jgi:hypothetical protein
MVSLDPARFAGPFLHPLGDLAAPTGRFATVEAAQRRREAMRRPGYDLDAPNPDSVAGLADGASRE